jgi:F0F1-type ATP synthase assembly protein I
LGATSHRDELARGWTASSSLISSIVAGLLLGLGLDLVFGTRPLFVVIFVVVAAVGGFLRLRAEGSAAIDAQALEAIRIRDGL